jgi:hypothetical protein
MIHLIQSFRNQLDDIKLFLCFSMLVDFAKKSELTAASLNLARSESESESLFASFLEKLKPIYTSKFLNS